MQILYGSNTGTCEFLAQTLAGTANRHGFEASVATLDSAAGHLSTTAPVIIITASYEGEPPDNAAHFVAWLKALTGEELESVNYAVFGCGHRK